jgi:hypothetical protein
MDAAAAFFGKVTETIFPDVNIDLPIFLQTIGLQKTLGGEIQKSGNGIDFLLGKINSSFALTAGSTLSTFKTIKKVLLIMRAH